MSFPGNNNTWGGADRKPSKYNKFVSEYFKKAPNPTLSKAAKAYKSKTCGKKYTNCKTTTRKSKPKSCKGYTVKLKKIKSKTARGRLRKKCTGYKLKKGKGMFGGECAVCRGTGEGLYGGCDCCGGTGMMEDLELKNMDPIDGMGMFGGAYRPTTQKRCVSTRATYNRLNDLLFKIQNQRELARSLQQEGGNEYTRALAVLNRYVGVYREMLSLYNRQNNLGDKFIKYSRNKFADEFPGYMANRDEFDVPFGPPKLKK